MTVFKESLADASMVETTVNNIVKHLQAIADVDYEISILDLEDLKEAQHLLNNIIPMV